ncbi:MAG: UpxY family transcription antiterminator [Caldisericia bacterium]|nr:UpxY family transcription antiterminator [Caldisericia bacterium]
MTDKAYETPNWYTLYTRSRHEKFVEEELSKKGIDAYTPKLKIKRRWSDRIKEVEEPLFKSYCFAKFPLIHKKQVISQQGVVKIINFNSRYVSVDENVIESLKILVSGELKIDPYPYLNKGDKVTIKKGPFKGLEGYIIEKRNKNTELVVSVDAIMSSIKCIIEADFVDLID